MSLIFISSPHLHKGSTKVSTENADLHKSITEFAAAKNVSYDSRGRTWVFTIDDAPLRVLNILTRYGYTIIPGGSSMTVGDIGDRKYWWMMGKRNDIAMGRDLPPSYATYESYPQKN